MYKASALYDYSIALAYMVIAIMLPVLSSIADSRGNKKNFMKFFCYLGGAACIGLFWFKGESPSVEWGVICSMLAAVGYVGSLVFYNSYLPEIASAENRDRVSARGYTMGYIGSVILQIVGFGLVMYFSVNDDNTSGPLYTFLLVGIWWIGFAQIPFTYLPDSKPIGGEDNLGVLRKGFIELRKVWDQVQHIPTMKWYLAGFLFYSMGVQTVMLAATLFGSEMLGLPSDKLIITIVIIQLVAIAGAYLMSRLSETYGNIRVLMFVVLIWIVVCIAAYSVASLKEQNHDVEFYFYGLAIAVGLVMGGVQSLSRSTYSKLMPATRDTASFFSFYDVTEKVAIVIGMLTFGYIDELLGMKNSVISLILFFLAGLIGLYGAWNAKKKDPRLASVV
jgi:UMF1 family MFS transporter